MRLAAALAALTALASAQEPVVVSTTYGDVQGTSDGTLQTFHKIPFAAPPVGNLRYAAPQPPASWDGVYDATPLPEPCPQLKVDGTIYLGSEDCLYLQIYVPEGLPGPLPVMFWIYGGAYVLGDSSEFGWYDGTALAKKTGAIIVTHNYRLGPLGFMALPSLQAADPNGSTGNAALQDQVAALQWVHDNIEAFGGDPTKVTIFGESAGGFSVCWHLVSEASAGLFSAAIMESGSCDTPQFFQPVASAISFNEIYAQAVGCTSSNGDEVLSCMRGISTEDVMKSLLDFFDPNWPFTNSSSSLTGSKFALSEEQRYNLTRYFTALPSTVPGLPALAPIMPWGPAIDGSRTGLKDMPLNLLQAGTFNQVPVILGTNVNEGSIFIPFFPIIVPGMSFPPTDAELPTVIEHALDMYPAGLVANLTELAMSYYPPYINDDNWARGSDILTHMFFTCGTRRSARALSQYVPTYLYQFSHKLSFLAGLEYDLLGDYHTSELYFVWRNEWPPLVHVFDTNDWTMADAINAFWGNFASTRNPNSGPLPVNLMWPKYSPASDINMQLQVPLNTTQHLQEKLCDMWDTVAAAL